jgi:hypothetical protein
MRSDRSPGTVAELAPDVVKGLVLVITIYSMQSTAAPRCLLT